MGLVASTGVGSGIGVVAKAFGSVIGGTAPLGLEDSSDACPGICTIRLSLREAE